MTQDRPAPARTGARHRASHGTVSSATVSGATVSTVGAWLRDHVVVGAAGVIAATVLVVMRRLSGQVGRGW